MPLSRSEKHLIAENRLFTIRSKQSSSNEVLASLTNSVSSSSLSTSVTVSTTSEIVAGKSIDITNSVERNLSKSKKKLNVKEAIIVEDDQEKKESETDSNICSSYLGNKLSFIFENLSMNNV